jgi:hypothetical protein
VLRVLEVLSGFRVLKVHWRSLPAFRMKVEMLPYLRIQHVSALAPWKASAHTAT